MSYASVTTLRAVDPTDAPTTSTREATLATASQMLRRTCREIALLPGLTADERRRWRELAR